VKPALAPMPAVVVVSDATALAVLGLTDRQFKAFLRQQAVLHFKQGRRTLARLDRILEAMDRMSGADVPAWDEATVIARAARGGRR
jgi:hypothetical protein